MAAKGVTREDFSFPVDGKLRIAVFRPDVQVGSLRVGGLDEANAEWTESARTNIQLAMENAASERGASMTFLGDVGGADGEALAAYRGLFQAVSAEIVQHQFLFDPLPTKTIPAMPGGKGKHPGLDWTLGPGAARLRDVTHADYAMFVFTHDSYGDAGRKVAQVVMAGLFGVYVPAGVHIGYAGLVDLRSGNIVWFNTNFAIGGDVREPDGATKRVRELLSGLPSRDDPEGKK
ncbi:MAG: hypothetical protein KGM17_03330 [Sphingomonadales bacterium]|nr:hypothetical protein [Sphingomonadales bacterium]